VSEEGKKDVQRRKTTRIIKLKYAEWYGTQFPARNSSLVDRPFASYQVSVTTWIIMRSECRHLVKCLFITTFFPNLLRHVWSWSFKSGRLESRLSQPASQAGGECTVEGGDFLLSTDCSLSAMAPQWGTFLSRYNGIPLFKHSRWLIGCVTGSTSN
jgi:hypothetical protein